MCFVEVSKITMPHRSMVLDNVLFWVQTVILFSSKYVDLRVGCEEKNADYGGEMRLSLC